MYLNVRESHYIPCYSYFRLRFAITDLRHILRCEETRSWREDLVHKRFTIIEPEIGIRRIATSNDDDKLQTSGLYVQREMEKGSDGI
jgi:hypothetical protein